MERIGKRLLSLTLAVLLLVTLLPAQAIAAELESLAENRNASGTFVDVPEGAWFYDAVEYVSGHDIFRGTSDTEFSPYGTMTRAMMVTVLGRLAQVDPADYTGARAFHRREVGQLVRALCGLGGGRRDHRRRGTGEIRP